MMLKAYVQFAAVASSQFDENGNVQGEVRRSRWTDLVTDVVQTHQKYMKEMSDGKFYSNIEKDPRKNPGPDEKIDIGATEETNPIDEGYSRKKSQIINEVAHAEPMPKEAEKFVNAFVERARKKKEEKAAEAQAEDKAAAEDDLPEVKVAESVEINVNLGASEEPKAEEPKEEPKAEVSAEEPKAEAVPEPVAEEAPADKE